jgi:hypothetical protein
MNKHIINGTLVPPPRVRTTPHIRGHAGRRDPWWLADARSGSSDNDLRSEWPNSSSDDLRADDAAIRPSPMSPLEGRGQASKAVELEVSPRVAPTISSAEKPLSAASVGGGNGSSAEAAQAGEPDTRQLLAPRMVNALPPPITEGRSGPLSARRQAPTRRTPLPSTDDEHP